MNIFKDNENWLLVLKMSEKRRFLAVGHNGKTILCLKKKSWTTVL
jgi:hypothetical protein